MTYTEKKYLAYSEKNFIVIIEPAIIISDWTLDTGTTYYNNFSISDSFLEYVSKVTADGVPLSKDSLPLSTNEYYWDWDNKKLYINIGANPSTKTIVVFFEIYFSTKTINTYRSPLETTTEVVYYDPRIIEATIPQIDQNDFLLFGSNAGSIKLNNVDAKFYVYDDVSFMNKNIKIYHVIDDLNSIKLIYKGIINEQWIDDNIFSLSYRQDDYLFNNQINSYFATGSDASKGFFNYSDFPNLDPNLNGYAIRLVYGVVDDLIPINIDYNEEASTTTNREWVVRSDATNPHQLSYNVLASPSSTTTRIYIGSHYFQVGDSLKISLNSVFEYTWVSDRGSDYIDVSPSLSVIPNQGTSDACYRSTFGYIKIKDSSGYIYNLAYGRDFTESIFSNNTLGFTLVDDFESNHSGLTLFDPKGQSIYCRCYGKKHATINDSQYGNLNAANLVLLDIFSNYIGLNSSQYNLTEISGLSTPSIGIPIPESLETVFPTYREIITKINQSILGTIYFDNNNLLSYRLLGPMGSSIDSITDKMLLSFKIMFEGSDVYNQITIFYYFKESANGSGEVSHLRKNVFSTLASYLHQVEKSLDIYTYIIKSSEAETIANRYKIIYEDWQRIYTISLKTQLSESLTGDVITIERTKMIGYNYNNKSMRSKNVKITRLKKSLTGVEADVNDQKNIEKNNGVW